MPMLASFSFEGTNVPGLHEDPFTGTVFVFRNRRATAVKVLVYDGQGFWLCQNGVPVHGGVINDVSFF